VLFQYPDGAGVDADGPRPAALGRTLGPLTADDGCRARDPDFRLVQVGVIPAQEQQLAAPCAGIGGQVVEGRQPVTARQLQKASELAVSTLRRVRAGRPGAALLVQQGWTRAPGPRPPRPGRPCARSHARTPRSEVTGPNHLGRLSSPSRCTAWLSEPGGWPVAAGHRSAASHGARSGAGSPGESWA
jgi:hypothetical protein